MTDPRFPIGEFSWPDSATPDDLSGWIDEIEATPRLLREAVADLDNAQLDTPYREDGWTLRQVAHHLPDSHINSYTRFKLALTEDNPTIRGYEEARWAELPDGKSGSIDLSLDLLDALHARWVTTLRNMAPEDFQRTFYHPEHEKSFTLELNTAFYAWHGNHHIAHITTTRKNRGW